MISLAKESKLQSDCLRVLKEREIAHLNVHQSGWTGKGFPDIVACIHGRFVCFELKVKRNKQQPDQVIWQKRIERSGGDYFVPYSLDEFVFILDEVTERYSV